MESVQAQPAITWCKHCQDRPAGGRRGLCQVCYEDMDVRLSYPTLYRRAVDNVSVPQDTVPLPDVATDATPGSEAKILVLMERASQRRQLHHPDDAKLAWGAGDWEQVWFAVESWRDDF